MALVSGELIGGRYQLLRPLARGGMGTVWVAKHVELETRVAIKFSHASCADDTAMERFKREAQTAAQLRSAHIVQVFDFAIEHDHAFLVMELLEGESLGARLKKRGALTLEEVAAILEQTAKALDVAHRAGIVHRDLKPENLFVTPGIDGEVIKVLDFGIAKHHEQNQNIGQTTSANVLLGSPAYMSPEQTRGFRCDARADLWALAVVLYQALSGTHPFIGNNARDTAIRICSSDAKPLSKLKANLPVRLDAFFAKALARNPKNRFQNIKQMASAFQALLAVEMQRAGNASGVRESLTAARSLAVSLLPRRGYALWSALALLVFLGGSTLISHLRAAPADSGVVELAAPAPREVAQLQAYQPNPRPAAEPPTSAVTVTSVEHSVAEPVAMPTKASQNQNRKVAKPEKVEPGATAPKQIDPVFGL